ncbi:unnamed protein product [Schistosoma mattheei]|uniref:Pre-mRNA 3'-end-processing endonuclease polyadenylation factor C-term domain-containing protein n=1 Tax=Schistosoma mattheei TaxID=31246 RepID=A0A3P8DJ01_9TREM|nr:unnamed protein product [Schistosoma mattheei]
MKFHLALLAGSVETVSQKSDNVQYRVFDAINITWRPQQITMEFFVKKKLHSSTSLFNYEYSPYTFRSQWQSNPTSDMYADAVQNVILRAAMQGMPPRGLPHLIEPNKEQFRSALEVALQDAFGIDCLEEEIIKPDANHVIVHVDSHVAEVNLCDLVRNNIIFPFVL